VAKFSFAFLVATLCGSDLHTFEGRRQAPVPTVLGHEIVGQIEEIGGGVAIQDMAGNRLQPGDRVSWRSSQAVAIAFFVSMIAAKVCEIRQIWP